MWGFVYTATQWLAQNAPTAPDGAAPAAPGGATPGVGTGAAPACGGGGMAGLLPIFLVFGVMMMFMSWSRQKQDKSRQRLLSSVAKGDSVITIGGICGTVESVTENHVVVEVDRDVTMKFLKSAISSVAKPESDKK